MRISNLVFALTVVISSCAQPPAFSAGAAAPVPADGDGPCAVDRIENVVPMSGGFSISPKDSNLIVYARPEGETSQIFRLNRATKENICLTCDDKTGGPRADRHKGVPSFLPDGKHFVLQVEMAEHPMEGRLGKPGAGWFNNLWITDVDGERWHQLTDYPHGRNDRFGALLPELSPDGKKIAWGNLFEGDGKAQLLYLLGKTNTGGSPWGKWRLNVADLGQRGGKFELRNIQSYRPGDGSFFEPQSWAPDGRTVMFAADAERSSPHAMDLMELDIRSGDVRRVTDQPGAWIEFGDYSPNGKKIAFMSSECCDYKVSHNKKKLRAELYLMDRDGSGRTRLTEFNRKGSPEHEPGGAIVVKNRWARDGRSVYFGLPFYAKNGSPRGSWLKQLHFRGDCGGGRR